MYMSVFTCVEICQKLFLNAVLCTIRTDYTYVRVLLFPVVHIRTYVSI